MSTLFRSKDSREVQQLEKEGAKAISIQSDEPVVFEDESYVMVVGEERIVLQPNALEEPAVKELTNTLLTWINDVLECRRIIVRDIIEDIYDGQVLGELLAELTKQELDVIPVTQSTYMQKNKLKFLLGKIDQFLGITPEQRNWSVKGIHSQEVVEIFHLLVALARHFRCPHPLPRHVQIKRIHLKQLENKLETKLFVEQITGDDIGPTAPLKKAGTEKDVFDKLFDEAPEKLEPVKRSLCQFCSKVLEELEIVVNDLESQFQSGVNLVLMLGLLEGYYIPHYLWHYTPKNFEEKLDNVKLAFKLMEDAGIPQERAKPEEIVHKDLKSTLRVLYSIFGKYKSHFQQQPHPQATPTTPGATSAV